jgi:periplasmic divalent cation tolerance protein
MTQPKPVMLFISAGSRDEAERLGEGMVEARLAACGSVIPTIHSFYRWEGKMKREHEALILLKTSSDKVAAIQAYLEEHHSYELPELLQVDVTGGSPAYLEWLLEGVRTP